MINIQQITDYITEHMNDPVPKFIIQREVLQNPPTNPHYIEACKNISQSKWYNELLSEQWDDGSWGQFHSMDSKVAVKQKFLTTESALKRARELSLPKSDPMIEKAIKLMEKYIREEITWPDRIEKHKDNGKSHLRSRPYATAAILNLFDPENPVVKPKRDVFAETLKKATSKGYFDEDAWEEENRHYRGPCLNGWNAFPVMILQSSDCMDDSLQRLYLDYLWHRTKGIYYLSDFPLSEKPVIEDKKFYTWIYTLEHFNGFSLFPEFMEQGALKHLLHEIDRLINDDVTIPKYSTTHYAESWRDKNKRKNDLILRITRLVIKCN